MVEISTSILSVEREELIPTVFNLEISGTDYFHIDVMDGRFVERDNIKEMIENIATIKEITNVPLDVHLMCEDVKESIDAFAVYEPSIITFHIEAMKNHEDVIKTIKQLNEYNIKASIAIKPDTQISSILEYLPYVHMILVMTVEPGKGGQELITKTIDKVKELSKYIEDNNLDTYIEVDGGIKEDNVSLLKEAGANIIVSGTAIVNSKDMEKTINKMKE